MKNDNILEIKSVSKVYNKANHSVKALDNVSFTIKRGEIFGLLGVNGAGKTTLSSIIATLHPPTSGDVLYNSSSIYRQLYAYRHAIGYCPQNINLDPYLNVEENLVYAGKYYLLDETTIKRRVAELLQTFNLGPYTLYNINELSGGTARRVLIARALMHNPKIVILDEPTVGLDPDIRRKLWEQIRYLKKSGITVILTTHYLDEAEALSDRVCILNKGRVQRIDSVKQLKEQHGMASLEDIFIQLTEEAATEVSIQDS